MKKTYLGSRRDTSRAHFAVLIVVVIDGDGGGERLWVWSRCDSIKKIEKVIEVWVEKGCFGVVGQRVLLDIAILRRFELAGLELS